MTPNALPTKEEINPIPECLDGQWAVELFLDKTVEEAETMFQQGIGWEQLNYLGPVAFRFYLPAAINYLHRELPNTDPPTISWFAYVIDSWLDYQVNELKPVASALCRLFEEYLDRYSRFEEHDAMASQALEYFRKNPIIPPESVAILQDAADEDPGLRTRMMKVQKRLSRRDGL
jgi:hypothetical protein